MEDKKLDYVNSKRLDKPLVALEIIRSWRSQDPPGRFLKLNEKTGLYEDVGDKKAREKTSQALRERAPELRRKQEEDEAAKNGNDETQDVRTLKHHMLNSLIPTHNYPQQDQMDTKTTRFAEGTSDKRMNSVKRSVLARDHSLGREYIPAGEAVTLDGFTWSEGVDGRSLSAGSLSGISYPSGRTNSMGSSGIPPHHYVPSRAGSYSSMGPLPSSGSYFERNLSGMSALSTGPMDDRLRQFSGGGGRYESWGRSHSGGSVGSVSMGSLPPMGPPQPIPYAGGGHYQPGSYGSGPHGANLAREHSLSGMPLRDASIGHSAAPFDRHGSGYWGNPPLPPPPPHGMPAQYHSPGRYMSSDSGYGHGRIPSGSFDHVMSYSSSMGVPSPMSHAHESSYGHGRQSSENNYDPMLNRSPPRVRVSGPRNQSPTYRHAQSPSNNSYDPIMSRVSNADRSPTGKAPTGHAKFDVDPAIAQTWSSQSDDYEKAANMIGEEMSSSWSGQAPSQSFPQSDFALRGHDNDKSGLTYSDTNELPRPDMVKRMTSNHNEDESNKRGLAGGSVKRAALNRDSSAAANALKAKYIPEVLQRPGALNKREVSVQEMDMLNDTLEQSRLGVDRTRPKFFTANQRNSTMDNIAIELMTKPKSLNKGCRTTTVEALAIDLDIETDSDYEANSSGISRPPTIRAEGRLSTEEYLDIVNEPLDRDDSTGPSAPVSRRKDTSVGDWIYDAEM